MFFWGCTVRHSKPTCVQQVPDILVHKNNSFSACAELSKMMCRKAFSVRGFFLGKSGRQQDLLGMQRGSCDWVQKHPNSKLQRKLTRPGLPCWQAQEQLLQQQLRALQRAPCSAAATCLFCSKEAAEFLPQQQAASLPAQLLSCLQSLEPSCPANSLPLGLQRHVSCSKT